MKDYMTFISLILFGIFQEPYEEMSRRGVNPYKKFYKDLLQSFKIIIPKDRSEKIHFLFKCQVLTGTQCNSHFIPECAQQVALEMPISVLKQEWEFLWKNKEERFCTMLIIKIIETRGKEEVEKYIDYLRECSMDNCGNVPEVAKDNLRLLLLRYSETISCKKLGKELDFFMECQRSKNEEILTLSSQLALKIPQEQLAYQIGKLLSWYDENYTGNLAEKLTLLIKDESLTAKSINEILYRFAFRSHCCGSREPSGIEIQFTKTVFENLSIECLLKHFEQLVKFTEQTERRGKDIISETILKQIPQDKLSAKIEYLIEVSEKTDSFYAQCRAIYLCLAVMQNWIPPRLLKYISYLTKWMEKTEDAKNKNTRKKYGELINDMANELFIKAVKQFKQ